MSSWIKVQLKNEKTVNIPLEQYLSMSDEEYEDLMNSDYGYYLENPFRDKTAKEKSSEDTSIDYEDIEE